MISNSNLIETLGGSELYREYERAYSETTGLPVSLRPVEAWNLPHHGKKHENKFCKILAESSASCAACLRTQEELSNAAKDGPKTVTCAAGLSDTAVPVKVGDALVGFLQTGQVFLKEPSAEQFTKFESKMKAWGGSITSSMEEAWFETRVVTPQQYGQMVKLLSIFGQQLSGVSNQLLVTQKNAEPFIVSRAKAFIQEHQMEDISLDDVARAVHASVFHFCKVFKKSTGITFTDYLCRVRLERAKNLLLNPNLRISEIAYEVGFQSLTHFNRTFKKVNGESPTSYRSKVGARR